MERQAIYAKLRSFDACALQPAEVERRTLALLSANSGSAQAVYDRFCQRQAPATLTAPPALDMEMAQNCLSNIFAFYGEAHAMGPEIDWESNPGTDHWGHDLNRFSYLPHLVLASQATGDPKYARKGAELVLDWVAKNEVASSWYWFPDRLRRDVSPYVWFSYLNIAGHLVQWSRWIDELVRFWNPTQLLAVLKSIHDQLAYLEEVIPTTTNNWLIIGCNGMVTTAARLPELRDQQRYLEYAVTGLSREAERQVLPDGVQFELTQGYHAGVARWLCQGRNAAEAAAYPVPPTLDKVTAGMLDYLMQLVTPDGMLVAFNDTDPASGAGVRSLLAEEGRRRNRADWLYAGTAGAEGVEPATLSKPFDYGGVYVMRTGWDADSVFLAFDGGPAGHSHRHWDKLSFWLSGFGRSFIVDPGRYLYDSHNPYTPYLKSTRAHSTITVQDQDQADGDFRETWTPGARLTQNSWEILPGRQRVVAEHTLGYGRGGQLGIRHRRSIVFLLPDTFLVLDQLTAAEPADNADYAIQSRLQFAPGTLHKAGNVWHTDYPDANLAVLPYLEVPFTAAVETGQLNPTSGWYSDKVNHIEPSPTLVIRTNSAMPLRGGFLLKLYRGSCRPELALELTRNQLVCQVAGAVQQLDFAALLN